MVAINRCFGNGDGDKQDKKPDPPGKGDGKPKRLKVVIHCYPTEGDDAFKLHELCTGNFFEKVMAALAQKAEIDSGMMACFIECAVEGPSE